MILKRKAFTLFELMIVVVLIGITYALVLSNFNTKKKVHILKLANIKEALLPFWSKGKRIDFYLYHNCKKSAIFINGEFQEKLKADIKSSEFEKIEVYKPNAQGEAVKVVFPPIMIENKFQKVCFQYTLFPNGSNSNFILKKKQFYYIFYPYFQDVNKSEDLSQAVELLQHPEYKGVRLDAVND